MSRIAALLLVVLLTGTTVAVAQTAPAPTPTPTPDPPAVKVDGLLFADYTYLVSPKVADASGRLVSFSQFNISRAYFTLTATLKPRIFVRATADVSRESGSTSSLNGSYVLRVKYAFMQFDLSSWLGHGAWARFGIQVTPYLDAVESVYRYRFQGTLFTERDAGMSGADAGATLHVELPGGHGDVHGGIYNGEGYQRAETNDQKSLQLRATFRPAPSRPTLKGVSVQFYVNHDHYEHGAPKRRALASAYFEHRRFNVGFNVLAETDQPTIAARRVDARGYSMFVTPFFRTKGHGPEALLRFDRFRQDLQNPATRHRVIVGAAYWFPHDGPGAAAIMLDFEQLTTVHANPVQPRDRRLAVHALVNF